MVRQPPPISLRLQRAEITARARRILHKFDEDIAAQRRVKYFAAKALVAIYAMDAAADIKLKSMSADARSRWLVDCRSLKSTLTKIVSRGVS